MPSSLSEPFPEVPDAGGHGVPIPDARTRWRCSVCGNLTRFDVVRTLRARDFVHFDLAGQPRIDERDIISAEIEEVRCRWCNRAGSVELVARPDAREQAEPAE